MDIGKSLSYIFEDPEWLTKILVGSLIVLASTILSSILIGVLGFLIIAGYGLEVLKNVRRGRQYPLPAWRDHWGEWLVLGLKLFVAVIVWALPAILLGIPMAVGGNLVDQGQGTEALGGILLACFGCLLFLWILVLILVSPAIYIRLAETEEFSSAFRLGDIFQFTRDNIGEVIVATIVYVVASFIVTLVGGLLGTLLCLVGLIITAPAAQLITTLIQSHLYGQIGLGGSRRTDLEAIETF